MPKIQPILRPELNNDKHADKVNDAGYPAKLLNFIKKA